MLCPFCTFNNDNKDQICQVCENFIKTQCSNCNSLNHIDNNKCDICNLYLDDTKNKKCIFCGCKNIQDNENCYNCELSFMCECIHCKYLRKEIKKEDMLKEFIKPFIKYSEDNKLNCNETKLLFILNINTNEIIKKNIIFILYTEIINFILDKDNQYIYIEKKYNNKINIDEVLYYYQQILLPVLRTKLINNNIDISNYELKITEKLSLYDEVKTIPVEKNIINKINNINIIENKDHKCFCADENNIKVLILPCCKNMVHINCIKKWLLINHICPYCKQKNCNL